MSSTFCCKEYRKQTELKFTSVITQYEFTLHGSKFSCAQEFQGCANFCTLQKTKSVKLVLLTWLNNGGTTHITSRFLNPSLRGFINKYQLRR